MYPSDMIDEQWSAKALSGRQACRQTPDAQPRDMLNAIFCHLLCASHRLSMARATQGLSTLETDLQQRLCPLPSARRVGYAAGASRCAPRQAGWALAWSSSTSNRSRPSQKGERGYDASKKIKGTIGLLPVVVALSAGISEPGRSQGLSGAAGCSCALSISRPSLPMLVTATRARWLDER